MNKQPAVYIVANRYKGTVYIGVTSNLPQRAHQHRTSAIDGFTKTHGCTQLVWYEMHETMEQAILREKQLKGGSRAKKFTLIERDNSNWDDLYSTLNF